MREIWSIDKFKTYKGKVENESGLKIKSLRSYRGGEFTFNKFNAYCQEHGICSQTSTPRRPQQNGIGERGNITILDTTRTMLLEGKVTHVHWREVVNIALYNLSWDLILEVMKAYFLVILLRVKITDVII